MDFIKREIDKIGKALRDDGNNCYAELYAAQQALEWALEPSGIRSPIQMITGTQEGSADCSADPHQPRS